MLALVAVGAIIQMMAANALYSVYKNSELVDEQDDSFAPGMRLLYKYAFATFGAAIFTVVLSLPLAAIRHAHYVDSVILFSEYLTLLPWLILISIILCIIGKKIAGNLLKTIPKEEVSAEKKQIIRALGKKTVIALVILLAITIGAQVTVNYLASRPRPALQFASLEEMEEFVEQAREYEEGKIYNQPMYENLSVFDWVDLKVHYAQDYDRLAARRSAIAGAFRFIYCAEIALVGIVYYRKRSRIA